MYVKIKKVIGYFIKICFIINTFCILPSDICRGFSLLFVHIFQTSASLYCILILHHRQLCFYLVCDFIKPLDASSDVLLYNIYLLERNNNIENLKYMRWGCRKMGGMFLPSIALHDVYETKPNSFIVHVYLVFVTIIFNESPFYSLAIFLIIKCISNNAP